MLYLLAAIGVAVLVGGGVMLLLGLCFAAGEADRAMERIAARMPEEKRERALAELCEEARR